MSAPLTFGPHHWFPVAVTLPGPAKQAAKQEDFQKLAVLLRAGDLLAQRAHRLCRGPTFMSDHTHFSDLYSGYAGALDDVLEFAIGTSRDVDLVQIDEAGLQRSLGKFTTTEQAFKDLAELNTALKAQIRDCREALPAGSDDAEDLLQGLAHTITQWSYKIGQRLKA